MSLNENDNKQKEKKIVLITGGSGWLAQFVVKALTSITSLLKDIDIFVSYRNKKLSCYDNDKDIKQIYMNIEDNDSIISCISSLKPSCIIHLAAISSLVVCNNEKDKASNCNSPVAMLNSIKQYCPDCLFVFSSTDLIYDNGLNPPYKTTSDSSLYIPLNIYGNTKLNFEQFVSQLDNSVILRLSNMISSKPYAYEDVGIKFLQFLQNAIDSKSFIGIIIFFFLSSSSSSLSSLLL